MPRYWLFPLRLVCMFWTQTPATLDWAVSWARSRMIKSVWSHIVAERSDPHRDVIALLNEKCWLQWPCAYSSDPTCVGHDLPFAQITSRWFGYIALKTQKAWCPDGYTLYNSSSSLLYTGLGKITGMLMASHALHRHHVDSVHARTAHRPSWCTAILTNRSTLFRPVARRTRIWYRSSLEKTGLPHWTTICHNRPKSRGIHFVFRPFSERTRCVLHYMHGLSQMSFPHGRRWKACYQNSARYGIIVTICQWMTTVHYGAREVHRVPFYSYKSPRPVGNNYFCLITLHCMVVTWDGHGPWRDWLTVSIGRECQMT